MANEEQVAILKQGVEVWNEWRYQNPDAVVNLWRVDLSQADLVGPILWNTNEERVNLTDANLTDANLWDANLLGAYMNGADLTGADLRGAKLSGADLTGADLSDADLTRANLTRANLTKADLSDADLTGAELIGAYLTMANLSKANLSKANLSEADLTGANLSDADLTRANLTRANLTRATAKMPGKARGGGKLPRRPLPVCKLSEANLTEANLTEANLTGADLRESDLSGATLIGTDLSAAQLVGTDLCGATLSGCRIYGVGVWDVFMDEDTQQSGLIITPEGTPDITVDNLKVAQFLYLILNNPEIRDAINTIHSKVVLILGRFSEERKPVLDALREQLRQHDYIPVMFDFEKPAEKSFIEMVSTLANMAHFIIADMTDAKLTMQELQQILSHRPTVPVQPLLLENSNPSLALGDFLAFGSFLKLCIYKNQADLLTSLTEKVIAPANQKAEELAAQRQEFEDMLRSHNTPI